MLRLRQMLRKIGFSVMVVFALIGFAFTGVFVAMQFGWLNVQGSSASRDQFFQSAGVVKAAATVSTTGPKDPTVSCVTTTAAGNYVGTCPWNSSPEWAVIRNGLAKDASVFNDVSAKTQVSSRLLASVVVPEQLRFFTSDRESFKKFFEPLKVLGAMTQFSLGVSGIKVATATEIEKNACTPTSQYYPGPGLCTLLAYSGQVDGRALYSRLTNQNNHYYSYLYTAIYLREIQAQWQKAGFEISEQPGIEATLFNIGFDHSHPNTDPLIGGSVITLNKTAYTFGELGQRFYESDELTDQFPAQ